MTIANEYSVLKSLKVYGLDRLLQPANSEFVAIVDHRYSPGQNGRKDMTGRRPDHGFLQKKLREIQYRPPSPEERGSLQRSNARKQIRGKLKELLDNNDFFEAKQAHIDYLNFWEDAPGWRKQNEKAYNAAAHKLWKQMHWRDRRVIAEIAPEIRESHRLLLRIVRKWARLGLADVIEIKNAQTRVIQYHVRRTVDILPDLLYSYDMEEYTDQPKIHSEVVTVLSETKPPKSGMDRITRTKFIQEFTR